MPVAHTGFVPEPAEPVVVMLPGDLVRFARACAGEGDISQVVSSGLLLLAEELGAVAPPFDTSELPH